jgi:hypothetical protein
MTDAVSRQALFISHATPEDNIDRCGEINHG